MMWIIVNDEDLKILIVSVYLAGQAMMVALRMGS